MRIRLLISTNQFSCFDIWIFCRGVRNLIVLPKFTFRAITYVNVKLPWTLRYQTHALRHGLYSGRNYTIGHVMKPWSIRIWTTVLGLWIIAISFVVLLMITNTPYTTYCSCSMLPYTTYPTSKRRKKIKNVVVAENVFKLQPLQENKFLLNYCIFGVSCQLTLYDLYSLFSILMSGLFCKELSNQKRFLRDW